MNKVGIVTLNGYFNYGNRLQNYALTKCLEDLGFEVYTIWDKDFKNIIKDKIKTVLFFVPRYRRYRKFYNFSRKYMKEVLLKNKGTSFDYIVVGSDQVWNPKYIKEKEFLLYVPLAHETVIGYATSFGTDNLPKEMNDVFRTKLIKYKAISSRESVGKEILNKIGIDKIKVIIDPTLLLSKEEWDLIKRKPHKLNPPFKYILKYFLGDLSEQENKAISYFAKNNGCRILDLADSEKSFYCSGPAEFISLIENAELVCTDSFHASVFSMIYDRSFVVFKRKGCSDYMYSRINNLLNIFHLENREFNGQFISAENSEHDYTNSYSILRYEREKAFSFIRKNMCK